MGITARNSIMAGIGFGIGIIISLVSIEELGREYLAFVSYGLIAAAIVFIGTNLLLNISGKKYLSINTSYANDLLGLFELKGWFIGASIKDKPNKEQIDFLAKFTFVISLVISYNIQLKLQELFKVDNPEIKSIEDAYQIAKDNLEYYKKLDLRIVKVVEKFVEEFGKRKDDE